MTNEQAKARAYVAAGEAFLQTMRQLVGEAGLAQLAGSEPDEHTIFNATGDGHVFQIHITVAFGELEDAAGLDEILDS